MKQVLHMYLFLSLLCSFSNIFAETDQCKQNEPTIEICRDDLARIAVVLSLCARASNQCSYVINCPSASDPLFDSINSLLTSISSLLEGNELAVNNNIEELNTFLSEYARLFQEKVSIINDELFNSSASVGQVIDQVSIHDVVISSKLMVIEQQIRISLGKVLLAFGAALESVDAIIEGLANENLSGGLENLSGLLEILADIGKGIE